MYTKGSALVCYYLFMTDFIHLVFGCEEVWQQYKKVVVFYVTLSSTKRPIR